VSGSSATITGKPGLLHHSRSNVGTAAPRREHHAFLGDVRAELGGRRSSADFNRGAIWFSGSVKRLEDLVRRDGEAARKCPCQLRPFTSISRNLAARERRARFLLDSSAVVFAR